MLLFFHSWYVLLMSYIHASNIKLKLCAPAPTKRGPRTEPDGILLYMHMFEFHWSFLAETLVRAKPIHVLYETSWQVLPPPESTPNVVPMKIQIGWSRGRGWRHNFHHRFLQYLLSIIWFSYCWLYKLNMLCGWCWLIIPSARCRRIILEVLFYSKEAVPTSSCGGMWSDE